MVDKVTQIEVKKEKPKTDHHFDWSTRSLIFVVVALVVTSLSIVLTTAPFGAILGQSTYALLAAVHGMMSFLLFIISTIGLYLGYRLFMGRIKAFPDLQLITTVMATLSFITIVFGNWIYIPYRAKTPDSPRSYFLANMPEVHKIFFEYKEFIALFTLPLSVAAAFILWRYGENVLDRKWTRVAVAILIALHFFYLINAIGLGAAVTKLRGI